MSQALLDELIQNNQKLVTDMAAKGHVVNPMVFLVPQIDMQREQLFKNTWADELSFNIEYETRVNDVLQQGYDQVMGPQLVLPV